MSKLAKKGIYIPTLLTCEIQSFNNSIVYWLFGSYSISKQHFPKIFSFYIYQNKLHYLISISSLGFNFFNTYQDLDLKGENSRTSALHSRFKQLLISSIVGFKNFLLVHGVGYQFNTSNTTLLIKVGYSNVLKIKIPLFRSLIVNKKATLICGRSIDIVKLNTFFARVRYLHLPDIYKGKGIRYPNELIIRKEGKKKKKV